jgi:hypothetical protein
MLLKSYFKAKQSSFICIGIKAFIYEFLKEKINLFTKETFVFNSLKLLKSF